MLIRRGRPPTKTTDLGLLFSSSGQLWSFAAPLCHTLIFPLNFFAHRNSSHTGGNLGAKGRHQVRIPQSWLQIWFPVSHSTGAFDRRILVLFHPPPFLRGHLQAKGRQTVRIPQDWLQGWFPGFTQHRGFSQGDLQARGRHPRRNPQGWLQYCFPLKIPPRFSS